MKVEQVKYIIDLRAGIENLIREKDCYFIGEDIQEPYGGAFKVTKGLSDKYPGNIIAVPMCEQGFTGLGIGMALFGCYVSVEIMFGDFITLAADQMVNHAAKIRELYDDDLHFVLRCPSGAYRGYGATHSQSIEKIYMGIPGIQIVSPSIAFSPGELLKKALESGIPSLFVENKLDYPRELLDERSKFWEKDVVDNENGFPIVRIKPLDGKPDATIITYGGMVDIAVSAAEDLLYEDEINVDIIVPCLLTDIDSVVQSCRTSKVVILEEGVKDFGWGAEVCCKLLESRSIKFHRIGAKNRVVPVAKESELMMLPSKQDVVNSVKGVIR